MLTPIDSSDVTNNNTVQWHDLPDNIPHDAYAVLVYAEKHAGKIRGKALWKNESIQGQ